MSGYVIIVSALPPGLECHRFNPYYPPAVRDRLDAVCMSGRIPIMYARVFSMFAGPNTENLVLKFVCDGIDVPVGNMVSAHNSAPAIPLVRCVRSSSHHGSCPARWAWITSWR